MSCPVELDCPFYPSCQRESWYIQTRVRAVTPGEAEEKFRALGEAMGYEVLAVALLGSTKPEEYEGSIRVASGPYRVVSKAWWDRKIAEEQAEALRRLTGQAEWHVIRTEPP
ncbi:MAG: hypothetical protein H5U02_00210 [Clostridia bacterium]|nr:hypothetical protein [Clostridia bacterium]